MVDQAPGERLVGMQEAAGQRELLRAVQADEPRQAHRAAPAGQQPDLGMRVGEAGLCRCDEQVAGQRDFQATGHGQTVDRADDGARKATQRMNRVVVVGTRRQLIRDGPLFEVHASGEGATGAGEDQHSHGGISLERRNRCDQLATQFVRQRVELVGPIQRERRKAVVTASDRYRAVAADHAGSSCPLDISANNGRGEFFSSMPTSARIAVRSNPSTCSAVCGASLSRCASSQPNRSPMVRLPSSRSASSSAMGTDCGTAPVGSGDRLEAGMRHRA